MTDYLDMLRIKDPDQQDAKEPQAAAAPGEPVCFTVCPYCNHELKPPSIEIQLENFRMWQLVQSAFFRWSPDDMKRLAEHMSPSDTLLLPASAYSVQIRRPDGTVYVFERR